MCISAIAMGISAAGLGIQAASAAGQYSASKKVTSASIRAENAREEQMRAEAMRRRRESIRQSMVANSLARARNVNQGAGLGSSVLFGAYGQTQGELGRQLAYTTENERIGGDIFAANRDVAKAQGDVATFQGMGKFGEALTTQATTISKIGTTLFGAGSGGVYDPGWKNTVSTINIGSGKRGYYSNIDGGG